jgi:large subunit ribosomal protein L24
MKTEWSRRWLSSSQRRKQRKYRHKAPLHVRHRFVSSNLSPDLRKQFGKRSVPLRKGDEIEVMVGQFRGFRGDVSRVNLSECKAYVEGVKVKKSDGSEVLRALEPSNLRIVKLNLDDKRRRMSMDRSRREERPVKQEKRK